MMVSNKEIMHNKKGGQSLFLSGQRVIPASMPPSLFKRHVLDLINQKDPSVFSLLVPFTLMASLQHNLAYKILSREVETGDLPFYVLRNNPFIKNLVLSVEEALQSYDLDFVCERLAPLIKDTCLEEIHPIDNLKKSAEVTSKVRGIAENIKHIVLAPDGNRRWAKQQSLETYQGHRAGAHTLAVLCEELWELGVHTITVSIFATENWGRDSDAVNKLMEVLTTYVINMYFVILFKKRQVKIVHLGRKDKLPSHLYHAIEMIEEATKSNNDKVLNLAIDYGGMDELVRAVQKIADKKLTPSLIDEKIIMQALDTGDQPYPMVDLLIRTGKVVRFSGLMPLQASYAEFFFPQVYFPDFTIKNLHEVLLEFGERERRFGK